jgi:Domain of unknown function (DUF4185)
MRISCLRPSCLRPSCPVVSYLLALPAAIFLAANIAPIGSANAATLSLVGSSTKVCQLIGDTDWLTHLPTAAKTATNFGLDAVDLGFPVDSGPPGRLYFLFGDAVPNGHTPTAIPSAPPDDALGFTTRTAVPDAATCLGLELVKAGSAFAHPTVQPTIQQGSFNVPTGGVFLNNTLYAFFWTGHCVLPTGLTPNPVTPLQRPAPSATCPETPDNSSIGRSVLAAAAPANPVSFHWTAVANDPLFLNMPSGFVYASAALPAPGSPPDVPVFGAPRYRASIPYLAMAPRASFEDADTWRYFAGTVGGSPVWISRQQWESGRNAAGEWVPPPGAEIFEAHPAGERCVGEHSVTWNAPLHVWLLLYVCEPWTVEARFAPQPWGPWSPPIAVLSAIEDPKLVCTLIQGVSPCPGLTPGGPWAGAFYAPFVMDRFTQNATPPGPGQPKRATIYWLVSTWNPYTVVVMQSTLELQ